MYKTALDVKKLIVTFYIDHVDLGCQSHYIYCPTITGIVNSGFCSLFMSAEIIKLRMAIIL